MNLAIIGATGNVGRKTIEILEKSKIEISKLFLVPMINKDCKTKPVEPAVEILTVILLFFILDALNHKFILSYFSLAFDLSQLFLVSLLTIANMSGSFFKLSSAN